MEVATTNNQSHHHHHHLPHRQAAHHLLPHSATTSAVTTSIKNNTNSNILSSGTRSPFQREVREWQRIDPDTGALLSGRLEADRWINGPLNSYGKISDSQNISQPNGTQHTQRKQFEVLQSRTANGSMQVIRTHTVQTTSSSSRWSSTAATTTSESSSSSTPMITMILGANENKNNNLSYNNNNNTTNSNSNSIPHRLSPHWAARRLSNGVDITEVSDDDDVDYDADDIDITLPAGDSFASQILNSDNVAIVDDDVDVDDDYDDDNNSGNHNDDTELLQNFVINGNSSGSSIHSNSSNSISNRHFIQKLGHNLLLDTAPSLKLSNLMKSSSSISSNSSNNSNTTAAITAAATAAAAMNTHRNAAKISLHAIVGNNTNTKSSTATAAAAAEEDRTATTSSSSATTPTTAPWHKRLSDQPDLYSNSNYKPSQSRVGVNSSFIGGGGVGGGSVDSTAIVRQTPTQQQQQQQQQQKSRRDLESFRHYNEHAKSTSVDDDDDAEDLRLTARHQRRQQMTQYTPLPLQRSHSISTDDLSITDWHQRGNTPHDNNGNGDDDNEEPGEWRRVSKLRRSFQSQIKAHEFSSAATSPATPRRPFDLPNNSVSVSRIRAELENGRRLNTAMRNNHVDLAALDTILNAPEKPQQTAAANASKRTTFLTAESLKEIRGKLKKLSDESLYKEDFLVHQTQAELEKAPFEVQFEVKPVVVIEQNSPTTTTTITPRSAFQPVRAGISRPLFAPTTTTAAVTTAATAHATPVEAHKSNSLESRQKYRDTNSSEWHLRRKSYGFEKMSPPEDRTIFRVDASTDSGLGRSGEQLGNWSPTETTAMPTRSTVIQFGKQQTATQQPQQQQQPQMISLQQRRIKSPANDSPHDLNKRHSIAVEESQYIRKTSQVHLNGGGGGIGTTTNTTTTGVLDEQLTNGETSATTRTQQKRVEFCKTEVHFAAESGRVNIVETEMKPPPTNNFRRRRRTTTTTTGPLQSLVKAATTVSSVSSNTTATSSVALPITHFGDDHRRKTIASATVAYKATLMDPPELVEQPTQVTVTTLTPKPLESYNISESTSRNSYTSTSGIDTTDNEQDEIASIRGILKNKPIKPKPYVLGENIENADALWGVQLKSINADALQHASKESSPVPIKSVAERVRIVEKRQVDTEIQQSNGYSTKINLSLGDKNWTETGSIHQRRRPSAQELLLQNLREHQRMLDEGLKSTSLIIKTMRSANAFDEAMRRLSIASVESVVLQPNIVVPTPMLRSNSYQDSTSSSRRSSNATITSSDLYGSTLYDSLPRRNENFIPLAPPRLKLLGNTEIPVSQQLTQLRRMYDAAQEAEEADSADEEVKRYFTRGQDYENSDSGGGTQDTASSMEDVRAGTEYSSSWSRLKAKRTVWKIEAEEHRTQQQQQQQQKQHQVILSSADLPKSNVMSIALHSPKAEQQQQQQQQHVVMPPTLRIGPLVPVAKPRTTLNNAVSAATTITQPELHTTLSVKQLTPITTSTTTTNDATSNSDNDSLKIVKEARGARKLRQHELSYFGVSMPKHKEIASPKLGTQQSSRRSLPSRKLSEHDSKGSSQMTTTTKWQLLNDRPDLLRHSPIVVEPEPEVIARTAELHDTKFESKSSKQKQTSKHEQFVESEEDFDEHFYENIAHDLMPSFRVKSPSPLNAYDRKTDVQRDEKILSEMTRNADQTLKALSDEAAVKDQRRRASLQRRNSKPLETIDEKSFTSDKTSDSLSIARGTYASEARRNSRQSTPSPTRGRSSSQSSIECPRARSRSLSSEREYENVKSRRSATQKSATTTTTNARRSSSRESMTQCSSGEENFKRKNGEERLRTRTPKRISSSSHSQTRDKQRNSSGGQSLEKQRHTAAAATTTTREQDIAKQRSSSMRERTERERKLTRETRHHSSSRNKHEVGDTTTQRTHRISAGTSGGSRVRSHSSDRHEKLGSGSRLQRASRTNGHAATDESSKERHHAAATQRLEREKDKLSRSRGHSSRSSHSERERERKSTTNSRATTTTCSNATHKKSATKSSSKHAVSVSAAATTTTKSNSEHELTHSKNAQILNGQGRHSFEQHTTQQQQQHHQHPLTTTTIAVKQRERHGKDRK